MQGCICPHPPLLIPEVGGDRAQQDRRHGDAPWRSSPRPSATPTPSSSSRRTPTTSATSHAVKTAPRLRGDFGRFRCPEAAFSYDNDVQFAELLLALAGDYRKLRIVPDDGEVLDWGVLVPLSFLRPNRIVSLSVVGPYAEHRTLGQLVRRCAEELGRDTLFLASGDLSHALIHGAPAPYDPRGKLFDDEVVSLLGVGDFAGAHAHRAGAAGRGRRVRPAQLRRARRLSRRRRHGRARDPQLRGALRRRLPGRALRPSPGGGGRRGMSDPDDASAGARVRPTTPSPACAAYVAGGRAPEPPGDAFYERRAACFVTLKKHGELRGCIGTLEPAEGSLGWEIARNAHSSAMRDPRFPPVTPDECEALTCSVDVLSPSEPCTLDDLDPQRYGVIVEAGLPPRRPAAGARGRRHRRAAGRASPARRPASPPDQTFDVRRFRVTRYRQGDPPLDDADPACDAADD